MIHVRILKIRTNKKTNETRRKSGKKKLKRKYKKERLRLRKEVLKNISWSWTSLSSELVRRLRFIFA